MKTNITMLAMLLPMVTIAWTGVDDFEVEGTTIRESICYAKAMNFLTGRRGVNRGTLVCRNLTLGIYGPTNHLDFAVSLMNAGLTETEREPIQPRTVRRWEPTAEELSQWFWGRPQ